MDLCFRYSIYPSQALNSPFPSTFFTQVANWMRLSLSVNLYGSDAIKELVYNVFNFTKCKTEIHSWFADAYKKKKNRRRIERRIWIELLGTCIDGCLPFCNNKTDLDQLSVVPWASVFKNLEYIIPFNVMSQNEILRLKDQFKCYVFCILENRNMLAHYPLKMIMPKTDFNQRWIIIRNALHGMNYTKLKQFDELKSLPLDPILRQKVVHTNKPLKLLEEKNSEKIGLKGFEEFVDINVSGSENEGIKGNLY